MPDVRTGRSAIILACVIIALAVVVGVGLIVSASRDDDPEAWSGRALGFVMVAVSLAMGAAIIRFGKPGDTHYWGMAGALTIAALLTGAYSYKPKAPQMGDIAEKIPLSIGEWRGTSHEVSEGTKKILKTEDIIMRTYQNQRTQEAVGLAVIFAMSKRKVAHPPEQCYAADGYEIEQIEEDSFTTKEGQTVKTRHLLIMRKNNDQVVLYWYRAGQLNTPSLVRMSLHVILSNLLMRPETRVGLIRLATTIENADDATIAAPRERLKRFAREVLPEIEDKLK